MTAGRERDETTAPTSPRDDRTTEYAAALAEHHRPTHPLREDGSGSSGAVGCDCGAILRPGSEDPFVTPEGKLRRPPPGYFAEVDRIHRAHVAAVLAALPPTVPTIPGRCCQYPNVSGCKECGQ